MSRLRLYKMIFLSVIVILSLFMIPGCMYNQINGDACTAAATAEPTAPNEATVLGTIDSGNDLISKFEMQDLEKESVYPVCDFKLVQDETTITIISCQWDTTLKLRIGIKGQNGVESSFETSRGSLSNVVPDFRRLPSGDYTLYIENIDDERISSVNMCYSIK